MRRSKTARLFLRILHIGKYSTSYNYRDDPPKKWWPIEKYRTDNAKTGARDSLGKLERP